MHLKKNIGVSIDDVFEGPQVDYTFDAKTAKK